MAETNSTDNIMNPVPMPAMLDHALELATEIRDESGRQYCLASMLTMQLDEHTLERGASEILEDRLSRTGQVNRLIDALNEIKRRLAKD